MLFFTEAENSRTQAADTIKQPVPRGGFNEGILPSQDALVEPSARVRSFPPAAMHVAVMSHQVTCGHARVRDRDGQR